MEISVAEQAAAFTGAVCLGFFVGVLYDLLRLLRRHLRVPFLGSVLDLLFWAVVTVSLFLFAAEATGGKVRIYVLLSVLGGAVAYFLTLSGWILGLGDFLADAAAFWGRLLSLPFRFICLSFKKIEKILKNLFLYRKKWFKIEATFGAMEDAARFGAARDKEGEGHESSQSKYSD